MKKIFLAGLLVTITSFLFAQDISKIINAKESERILRKLASDEMKGRKTFSVEIDKAADFIASEFKAIGLQTWNNGNSYRQEFNILTAKQTALTVTIDGQQADAKAVVVITAQPELKINQSSGYEKAEIKAGASLYE